LFTIDPTCTDASLDTAYVSQQISESYWEVYFLTAKDLLLSATCVKNSALAHTFNYYARSQTHEKQLLALSCLSVCPNGTAELSLEGFSLNLIFEQFSTLER
jgi:hypothetical protein